MNRRSVLLWGGKGTGKSGFLGALWHLDVESAGAGEAVWAISPTGDVEDRQTREYLTSAEQALLNEERRPTEPSADYPYLRITVRKWINGNPVSALALGFQDPAGEFADDVTRAREQGAALLDYMVHASGIIWLIDCTGANTPDFTQVMRQLTSLRQRNRGNLLKTPLALCLSKIDTLDDAGMRRAMDAPRQALEQAMGSETFDLFARTFTNVEYFAISSKGCTSGAIEPIGLTRVLDWIDRESKKQERTALVGRYWKPAAVALVSILLLFKVVGAIDNYFDAERAERARVEQDAMARLELAEVVYAEGATDSVVSLLSTVDLPRRHARSIDVDTLLALSAFEAGMAPHLTKAQVRPVLVVARERIDRVLEGDRLAEPANQARFRFRRAVVCIPLDCELRDIRRDLEFVVEHAASAELRNRAASMLEPLRR